MTNDAYGTVEVPAAPKKKSIKRLVVTSAAISLALGFATVTAVDHGLINLSSNPYVQIKLRGTGNPGFCLGVLNRKEAKQGSNLIIYGCDSKMIGQAFQIEEVGSNTYNIKYNTKNGGSKYDETLCVNYPTGGGTLQLYKCKKNDAHSEWTYQGKKLMVKEFGECMATEGSSQSSLSNSNYVDGMWCGEKYTKWDMPVPPPRPTPRPSPRPSSGACNHYCEGDHDCVWLGGSNPCKTCYRNECVRNRPPTPAPRPSSGGRCNDYCYKDSDCKTSCSKCVDYGDGVRKWCQKPQKGQCDRQCSANWDCSNDGGKWTTGQPWCGQCKNGWCSPNKQSCNYDYDCPRDKAVCGPNGYCVGK